MKDFLVEEQKFYDEHKAEYLQKYEGKYVLIYQNKLQGVFDDPGVATKYAYDNKFRHNHYMVKPVQEEEEVMRVVQLKF